MKLRPFSVFSYTCKIYVQKLVTIKLELDRRFVVVLLYSCNLFLSNLSDFSDHSNAECIKFGGLFLMYTEGKFVTKNVSIT